MKTVISLTERCHKLESYKIVFPSLFEVETEIQAARKELDAAMQRKEFRRCGDLQQKVSALENKLNETAKIYMQTLMEVNYDIYGIYFCKIQRNGKNLKLFIIHSPLA